MEIKEKKILLQGMHGWNIRGANISLTVDDYTDSYSVKISGIHQKDEFEYLTKEEMELLMKLFKIKK